MARKKAKHCPNGRRKDGHCRKRAKTTRRTRKCKTIRLPGRKQLVCKVGRRWRFAKRRRAA